MKCLLLLWSLSLCSVCYVCVLSVLIFGLSVTLIYLRYVTTDLFGLDAIMVDCLRLCGDCVDCGSCVHCVTVL